MVFIFDNQRDGQAVKTVQTSRIYQQFGCVGCWVDVFLGSSLDSFFKGRILRINSI